jgi:hypothetical protein
LTAGFVAGLVGLLSYLRTPTENVGGGKQLFPQFHLTKYKIIVYCFV